MTPEQIEAGWLSMEIAPRDGRFVTLKRSNGTERRAQWVKADWSIWRDPEQFYWVDEGRKFAEVSFAQAEGCDP